MLQVSPRPLGATLALAGLILVPQGTEIRVEQTRTGYLVYQGSLQQVQAWAQQFFGVSA